MSCARFKAVSAQSVALKILSLRKVFMGKEAELGFLDFRRRVTLRQIEILASLKDTGSISETARRLKTSPASISRICHRFEAHFSFPVFDKKRKGLVLTERGSHLIQCISKISEDINPHYQKIYQFFQLFILSY